MTQTPTPKGDEEQEMTVEMKAALQARDTLRSHFEKILGADPVCGGRVSSSAVERLVDAAGAGQGEEAAARIEALEREIEGLRSDLAWEKAQSNVFREQLGIPRTALTAPSMKENEDETTG